MSTTYGIVGFVIKIVRRGSVCVVDRAGPEN